MYLHQELSPLEAIRLQRVGLLPSTIKPDVLSTAKKIEVWATGFKDAGPDYCEIRVTDKSGALHKGIMGGY